VPAPVRPVKIRLEVSGEAKSDNSRPDPASLHPMTLHTIYWRMK